MKPSEVLKLMNDISENIPLSLEYSDDGRHTWPKRWETLFEQILKWENKVEG